MQHDHRFHFTPTEAAPHTEFRLNVRSPDTTITTMIIFVKGVLFSDTLDVQV